MSDSLRLAFESIESLSEVAMHDNGRPYAHGLMLGFLKVALTRMSEEDRAFMHDQACSFIADSYK